MVFDETFYHLHAKVITRGAGESIARYASYVTKERVYDNYTGTFYNYRADHPTMYRVAIPANVPKEYNDLQFLLNALNMAEKRVDAQMARMYEVALPLELGLQDQIMLVNKFVEEQFVKNGQAVIIGIHLKKANTEGRDATPALSGIIKDNPHMHLIVLFRHLDENGFM